MKPIAFTALLALTLHACSFMFVERRPTPVGVHAGYPDCTDDSAAPLADIGLGLVAGAFAGAAYQGDETAPAIGLGILTAVFASSLVYGLVVSSRCHAEKAKWKKVKPFRGFVIAPDGGPPPSSVDAGDFADASDIDAGHSPPAPRSP